MILEKQYQGIWKYYYVSINQIIYDENDKSKMCQNYPNKNYNSYGECTAIFTKNEYQAALEKEACFVGQRYIVPIFSTKDSNEVSKLNVASNCTSPNATIDSHGLFRGTIVSRCLTPCKVTQTNSVLTNDEKRGDSN